MNNIKVGDLFFSFIEDYGNTVYQCTNVGQPCQCGENDRCMLQIVCNNNFGIDQSTMQFSPYNQHKGKFVYDCQKNIFKNIQKNIMKKYSEQQAIQVKRKLIQNEANSL